jgi:hypothetical protein
MKTYSEKLKDPRWQRKRLEIMQRDLWMCAICCDPSKMLAVHHRYYIKGREPWEYPNWSLKTLCPSCHECDHESIDYERHSGFEIPGIDHFEELITRLTDGTVWSECQIIDFSAMLEKLQQIVGRDEAISVVTKAAYNRIKEEGGSF